MNDRPYGGRDYASLITQDLGYCCPWIFFRLFKKDRVIADRLGISRQRVNFLRQKVKAGEIRCLSCPGCLKKDEKYIRENLP